MAGGTTSEISGYRQPNRKNAHEIAHRTAGALCLSALINTPLASRTQSLPRGRCPAMRLSQWARARQRLRLLGAGVEVRNEGLAPVAFRPLLISHATWVSKADSRRRSLSLSSSSAGGVLLCGGARAQDHIDLRSAGHLPR